MTKSVQQKILLPSVVGTTGMTAFSYLYAAAVQQPFKEPELLEKYLSRLLHTKGMQLSRPMAWLTHYLIGAAFVGVYHPLWKRKKMASLSALLLLGTISGLVGVSGWHLLFKSAPGLLKHSRRNHYYAQLVLAHIIFCACARASYK